MKAMAFEKNTENDFFVGLWACLLLGRIFGPINFVMILSQLALLTKSSIKSPFLTKISVKLHELWYDICMFFIFLLDYLTDLDNVRSVCV